MTAGITAPTDPIELLAPVTLGPAPGRTPAGGFDLLITLLQAQLAPPPTPGGVTATFAPATTVAALASEAEGVLDTLSTRRPSRDARQDGAITTGDGQATLAPTGEDEIQDLSAAVVASGLAGLQAPVLAPSAPGGSSASPASAQGEVTPLPRDAGGPFTSSAPTGGPTAGAEESRVPLEVAPAPAPPKEAEPLARIVRALRDPDGGAALDTVGEDIAQRLAAISPRVTRVAAGAEVIAERTGQPSRDAESLTDRPAADGGIGAAPTAAAVMAAQGADAPSESARPEPARDPVDQIATRLRDVKGPGRHEISLRLDPPDLGAVRIDARLEGARLHLQIHAEHAPTGELLADALPRLREALSQQGFVSSDVSVHLGFDATGRQFTRDNAPTFTPPPDGVTAPPPAVVRAPAALAAVATDGLDVWA